MDHQIRKINLEDFKAIQAMSSLVFGDNIDESNFSELLTSPHHLTLGTTFEDQLIAFTSIFFTFDSHQRLRCEIDLLAVAPDFQGRGIGKHLIAKIAEYLPENIIFQRALIRTNNRASQKVFQSQGFQKQEPERLLYILDKPIDDSIPTLSLNHDTLLTPVLTLTYKGFWLEGNLSPSNLQLASHHIKKDHILLGALIPTNEYENNQQDYQSLGGNLIGSFHWWLK
ncbi:hypothetical protein MASR2M15_02320 [Anaerolineales bacterium]